MAGRSNSGLSEYQDFVADTGTGNISHVVDDGVGIWNEYGVSYQPAWAFVNDDGSVEVTGGRLGADGLQDRIDELNAK